MTRLRGVFTYLVEFIFRWVKVPVEPGLIEFGHPDENSPVFLTCNYDLTVRRVSKYLKNLDCYLLVAPTKGINVWCASCGGDFNAHSVISVIKTTGISDKVKHRTIIAPQLSAPGIDVEKVREETGWNIRFGPVYAKYIPEYVKNGFRKTEDMRKVKFTVRDRLEMASIYFFTMVSILVPILFALALLFPKMVPISMPWWILQMILFAGIMVYSMYLILPSMPVKSGLLKVMIGEIIFLVIIALYSWITTKNLFSYSHFMLLSILVSLILTIDFNGTTPTQKSGLGEFLYKRGAKKMTFLTGVYELAPYGNITMDEEKCIGCGICIEVCPKNVYQMVPSKNKVQLAQPEACVNCHACERQCPVKCLEIKL